MLPLVQWIHGPEELKPGGCCDTFWPAAQRRVAQAGAQAESVLGDEAAGTPAGGEIEGPQGGGRGVAKRARGRRNGTPAPAAASGGGGSSSGGSSGAVEGVGGGSSEWLELIQKLRRLQVIHPTLAPSTLVSIADDYY